MQSSLQELLRPEHILVDLEPKSTEEAIRHLCAALVDTGHVQPEFEEDVWAREQTYPTGLPTQPLAVAIPHADPDHVNRTGICIGVLNSPVRFSQMGTDGSVELEVGIIFLLAIKEKEKQVEMIQQVISLIQSGSLLEGLSKVSTPAEALTQIHKILT